MTPQARKVLEALDQGGNEYEPWYFPFKPIAEHAGFDVPTTRRLVRYLARKGYAEFAKGLWSEDGEPRGSGYCITKAGREYLR